MRDSAPLSETQRADRALVERLKAGDESALNDLFDRYLAALVRFADASLGSDGGAAGEAGDVVSDVLTTLWERRAALSEVHNLRAYLYRAVRNRALNSLRAERRSTERDSALAAAGELPGMASPESHHQEQLEDAEQLRIVWGVVGSMREPLRTVAVLRWSHGLSFAEIAEVLATSEAAARTHASRALDILRTVVPRLLS